MARRLVVALLQGLVLIALVGSATAWAVRDKRVTLLVDGRRTVVSTHATTVGDVLARAGVSVRGHDLVAPDRDVHVQDGDSVVVRRGRPVDITIDGVRHAVWVTAQTVDELLTQLDMRNAGLWLSASRSRRIPLSGITLRARAPKEATVVADGRPAVVMTTVPTVRELLAVTQVTLGPRDRASLPLDAALTDGVVVTVTRVRGRVDTVQVAQPQQVVRRPDPTLYKGRTRVLAPGAPGVVEQTWELTWLDGRLASRRLLRQAVRSAPVTKIVAVGTKPVPVNTPKADGLNWAALARCESGGNPRAYNPAGYYGLYQFDVGTWHGVGGSGLPSNASASEQTYRAQLLYARRGASPWPVCGRNLFT